MNIAIDYDNTYTKDPEMWLDIIGIMQSKGHHVMCVTFRHEFECEIGRDKRLGEIDPRLKEKVDEFIATGRRAKFKYLYNLGIGVDIWIDDDPLTITGHHPATIE